MHGASLVWVVHKSICGTNKVINLVGIGFQKQINKVDFVLVILKEEHKWDREEV